MRGRARELEDELRVARGELETYRGNDADLSQTMANALRRASEIEDAAQERARAIIASAEEAALRTRSDAQRRIEQTGGQFDELVRLKKNLVGSMRAVIDEFEQAIARVERGEQIFTPSARADEVPAATAPPPLQAAPVQPPPSSAAAGFTRPAAPDSEPGSSSAQPGLGSQEQVFETHVELDAGPFADFASLSAFERALAHLPGVDDVYVRRLADDRALIELTLSEPSALLVTMRDTLPYELDVRGASRSSLVLNVYASSAARAR